MHRMMLTIPAVLTEGEAATHARLGDWPRRVAPAPVVVEAARCSMRRAAEILGIRYETLKKRVQAGTFRPRAAIVSSGRTVEFYVHLLRGPK
jgi:hypothetical protein